MAYPYGITSESCKVSQWCNNVANNFAEDGLQDFRVSNEEAEDEEEELNEDLLTWSRVVRVLKAIFGSFTIMYMMLVVMIVLLVLVLDNRNSISWSTAGTMFLSYFCIGAMLLTLRGLWINLILKPFLFERQTINLITCFLDPEFSTLLWTIGNMLFTAIVWRKFKVATSLILGGLVSDYEYEVIWLSLVFIFLWACRDVCVKTVIFKLMLGFLMNFNTEVVQYLHKYSQVRKLNAALINLCGESRENQQSVDDLDGTRKFVVTNEHLRQIATLQNQASNALNKLKVSNLDEVPKDLREMHWNFDFGIGRREKLIHQFHVQNTGRELPKQLDTKFILATQKSNLANLLAINWLKEQLVALFIGGRRCELKSKKDAQNNAQMLFKILLELRTAIIYYHGDLKNESDNGTIFADSPLTNETSTVEGIFKTSPDRRFKMYTDSHFPESTVAAIAEAECRKVRIQMPDDKECLTQDFLELFMNKVDVKALVSILDPGKLGKITSKMFVRGIVETYNIRKQIVHSLEAQEEMESVFNRVATYLLSFLAILVFLLILGVSPNTIIVTGVSILTAAGVVLSKNADFTENL